METARRKNARLLKRVIVVVGLSLAVLIGYWAGVHHGRTGSELSLTKEAQAAGGVVKGPN